MKLLYFITAIILLTTSCKKTEVKDFEKAGNRLKGIWTVKQINIHTTDTAGNVIADSSQMNRGTVTFAAGDPSGVGADFFDHADFTGPCATSDLVLYFSNVAAGQGFTNGWSLEYDADPDDLRVQFWAESPGGSYHISVNHSYSGGAQQWFYVIQPTGLNRRIFYTWTLVK